MAAHGVLCGTGVAFLDGVCDPVVLGEAGVLARRALRLALHIAPGHGAAHLIQLIEQGQQQDVVGSLCDGTVKQVIVSFVIGPVRRGCGLRCVDGALYRRQSRQAAPGLRSDIGSMCARPWLPAQSKRQSNPGGHDLAY